MKMFSLKRKDKNEDFASHSERATATSTVAAQKPKPKATPGNAANDRNAAGASPAGSSAAASNVTPIKGQNRVNQRRAGQKSAKTSSMIEREMSDLNKQYQVLRGELKVQLVQDRKHEKQRYETLVGEQKNLGQQLADAKVTLQKQDKVVMDNGDERKDMVAKINAAQKQYDDAKRSLTKSDQTLNSLQQKISQSERSLADLRQNEANMRKAIQGEQDLKKLFVLMKDQEKQAQDLYSKSDAINSELVKLQKREQSETRDRSSKEHAITTAEKSLHTAQDALVAYDRKTKNAQDEQSRQLNLINQKINRLQHDYDQNEASVKGLQQKIESIDAKLKSDYGTTHLVSPVEFDQSAKYFLFSNDLIQSLSEDEKTSMSMIMGLLKNEVKGDANVVTINYNDSLPDIWKSYQNHGLVEKNTGLFNMYYALQAKVPGEVAKSKPELPDNPAWQYKRNSDQQITSIADDGGNLIMDLKYRKSGAIWYITYFNGSIATRRDVYDAAGFLSVTQYLDRTNNSQVTLENFYRPDRSIAMIKQYGSNHELSIQLVNKDEAITNVFHSEAQLLTWWLSSVLQKQDSVLVMGVNTPLFDQCLKATNEHFHVLPIVSANDLDNQHVKDIIDGKSKLSSLVVTDHDVQDAIEKKMTRDLEITIMPTVSDRA
ncbi:hypothetical protein D1831_05810 [Lactiplantibacillus garii]|uniref:LepB n=1 Tax=Lactiplantibacillus garii TaxID=2306423 RepID=A0A426D8E0_9LACO|nr:hypothetical protein [Lactiplantibacillus garii]RRK10816.1 hypothetical protein D1831_05810 [Lactiplantibacillus garii]